MNPLGWVLLAFPVYLFRNGRFVDYLNLTSKSAAK
jgi:hypothetical protein